jgi:oxygen-independent coproporphyrinogen-3 oxidase
VIGLYVHVPYCTVRCSYCSFYLVPRRGRDLAAYGRAVAAEIAGTAAWCAAREEVPGGGAPAADTLHFGGGTPSLLAAADFAAIVSAARAAFGLKPGSEIAVEANPEDLTPDRLAGLRDAGVTRLAIGVQSLDDRLLRLMLRPHDASRAREAVQAARQTGFGSLAADLILGLPGQETDAALRDVDALSDLGIDHLSLYVLEVHDRTRLGRAVALGRTSIPLPDAVADLYDRAADRLALHGFEHYEISNFARPGHRSRHNLKYWTDQEYLGFGPSAHSYFGGERWSNPADLPGYLRRGGSGLERVADRQSRLGRGTEALLAGLRLAEGVDLEALRRRYDDRLPGPGDPAVAELVAADLVETRDGRLRLTRRGRLLSNEVLERLMPAVS